MPPQPEKSSRERSWPRRLLNRMEVDRAVFYALAMRVWQLLAGPVTMVLIAAYFSLETQGFFYTFGSLMALATFAELSLSVVILNVASHEWSKLRLDDNGVIDGDAEALSRLISLGRFAFRWFAGMALLFAVAMGLGGGLFLAQKPQPDVTWLPPWTALVVLTSLSLWSLPFTALLVGSGQIRTVNRFRVIQAVTGNLAVWTCIPLGAELWTAVVVAAVTLFWDFYTIMVHYRRFYRPFFGSPRGPVIDVRHEVLPLQWRIAVQSVLLALASSLFTLALFHYDGAASAGRMGMTWTALTALHRGTLAWVQTRAPRFGVLIAQRQYGELDRIFKRVTAISLVLRALGSCVFVGIVVLLNLVDQPFANRLAGRLLEPLPLAVFVLAVVLDHIPHSLTVYARAHKREPYFVLNVLAHGAIVISVWLAARSGLGALGIGGGYLAVTALFTAPMSLWIWLRYRTQWR